MIPYTLNEAKRRFWLKRISEVDLTSRRDIELRAQLLGFLKQKDASTAINAFNLRRGQLLSPNHGQGLSWKPHPGFLWRVVKLFIGLFVTITPTGSLLRQTLESEEANTKTISASPKKLSEYEQFEDFMFENPDQAFQVVCTQIESLPEQTQNDEEIMTVLERLYALRLSIEPMCYFNLLQKISQHAPAQTLSFLYQRYNNSNETLNEHEFLELHLMAQTLMDHCVRFDRDSNINQHLFNIHYLLILMNAAPVKGATTSPIDELIQSIIKPEQKFHTALYQVYAANRAEIIESLEKQIPEDPSFKLKRTQIIQSFENSPINILKMQFAYKHTAPNNPLTYYFSRLTMEQVLSDHVDEPHNILWSNFGLDNPAQGSLTIQLLSEKLLRSWNNQHLTAHDVSTLLTIAPGYSLIFSSFKDIEQDWVSPLILSLKQGGIDAAKTTILNKSSGGSSPLTPSQIEWIIHRTQPYLPKDAIPETIQQLQEIFSLQDWISPLRQIIGNSTKQMFETAQAKMAQNLACLKNGTKHLNEHQIATLIKLLSGEEAFNRPNDPSIKVLSQLLEYKRSKDTRKFITVEPAAHTVTTRDPLLAHGFYSRRNTSQSSLAKLKASNKIVTETDATNDGEEVQQLVAEM